MTRRNSHSRRRCEAKRPSKERIGPTNAAMTAIISYPPASPLSGRARIDSPINYYFASKKADPNRTEAMHCILCCAYSVRKRPLRCSSDSRCSHVPFRRPPEDTRPRFRLPEPRSWRCETHCGGRRRNGTERNASDGRSFGRIRRLLVGRARKLSHLTAAPRSFKRPAGLATIAPD